MRGGEVALEPGRTKDLQAFDLAILAARSQQAPIPVLDGLHDAFGELAYLHGCLDRAASNAMVCAEGCAAAMSVCATGRTLAQNKSPTARARRPHHFKWLRHFAAPEQGTRNRRHLG